MDTCEPPFWEAPLSLVTHFSLIYDPICPHQRYNFAMRLFLLALLVGGLGTAVCGSMSLIVSLVLAAVIGAILVVHGQGVKEERREGTRPVVVEIEEEVQLTPDYVSRREEGFTAYSPDVVTRIVGIEAALPYGGASPYSGPALPANTPPTSKNLFMNVLLDEYKYNPDRPAAAPVTDPMVKQVFDDYFKVQWFSDPTDVFGKSQNQRQFVTQPSTSVPNDRKSFQDWLYKIPGKTCKEGGQYCTDQGSAGVQFPWMGE